jgi:hypothetical protein
VSAKDIQICIGIDVDAVAGWLGSNGGQASPNDIQRGMFAGEMGTPIETFPQQMAAVAAGHEIGAHGYSHENPIKLGESQEEAVLAKSIELIDKLAGQPPRGYVAPWWEM